MSTKNIRLGSNESKLIFTLEKDGKIVFTAKDAKEILQTSDYSIWNTINGLKRKRRIKQIQKGIYLLSPARAGIEGQWTEHVFTILPRLLRDYYVGFWSALSYWGMTEQIPRTTYVVTTARRKNVKFDDQMVQFVTYPNRRFFGYVQEKIGEVEFNISGREKTIVDSLAHPEYAGGISEVAKAIWTSKGAIDSGQMIEYAKQMKTRAVCLRLGYLLELLNFDRESYEALLPEKPTGAPWLDPSTAKKKVGFSSLWGLRLNVPEKVVLHWK